MMGNTGPRLGFAPAAAVALPFAWKFLWTVGVPLVLTAGGIAVGGALVKSAVPDIPINRRSVGRAALLGGGGVAAYYLSDLLPEKWKPAAYIGAVAGISGALYFLFSEPGLEPTPNIIPSLTVPPEKQVPKLTPAPMVQAFDIYVDPDQPNTGGSMRWPWGDQEYEVYIKNNMTKEVVFFVGVSITTGGFKVGYTSPIVDPRYGRKQVTLPPGKDDIVKVRVPSVFSGGAQLEIGFELFQQGNDARPFRVTDAVPITYTVLPLF
jgi:hypothetical protein